MNEHMANKAEKKSSAPERGAAENWDQRLGFLMHDVSRLRRKVFDEVMKPEGITRSQWWVLAHLSRHDGMSQSDLADRLDLGRAALGGLIDRLEAMRLVRRGADGQDRRAKLVFLTADGVAMIERMRGKSDRMSEAILEGLSQAQRHQLADMLSLVKANLLAFDKPLD
ncbi:HTH-type transcriptional repressor NicR [Achromobacter anxifer]|jgi:MarR family transcriptional regulator for hemolysin|uniref:HTH-type transcriptional repressor NicR n=2 Tax=Achromobacter anxifer TaxID=1287737 RepID=A0A6S7E405_9BURK|nr:HTH-type transcriptional repressor NicR [Achromobacter anxifer]CAB5511618.1 HTH-type transcriptional repressor NicR [Achromobacter anxifer]